MELIVIGGMILFIIIVLLCNSGPIENNEQPTNKYNGYQPYYVGITYHSKAEKLLDKATRKGTMQLIDKERSEQAELWANYQGGKLHYSYKEQKALEKALARDRKKAERKARRKAL